VLRLSLRRQQSAESKSAICRRAFDLGITHFDLANNNELPPGDCYSVKTQAFSMDESLVGLVSGAGSNGPHGRRPNVSDLVNDRNLRNPAGWSRRKPAIADGG
jgi:hypothetical protein